MSDKSSQKYGHTRVEANWSYLSQNFSRSPWSLGRLPGSNRLPPAWLCTYSLLNASQGLCPLNFIHVSARANTLIGLSEIIFDVNYLTPVVMLADIAVTMATA